MHAGEQAGIHDVIGLAVDDHLLVGIHRPGLFGGDEGGAHVGEICAHGLRGQNRPAGGDGAAQGDGAVKPLAQFLHQRERALDAGMPAGTGGHRHQAVGALLDRLVREFVVDDVVQHHAAIAVRRIVDVGAGTQRGDDDRDLVLHTQRHVLVETGVRLVHDLVDRKRCRRCLGVRLVIGRQRFGDLGQPLVQLRRRARIERRHGTDDAGLTLRDDQFWPADDEQGRSDDRQTDATQGVRQGGTGHK